MTIIYPELIPTSAPKDFARLTVDGKFVHQCELATPCAMSYIKNLARQHAERGSTVKLTESAPYRFRTACPCGGSIEWAQSVHGQDSEKCPKCDGSISSANAGSGQVYGFMTAAFAEYANAWYDMQGFEPADLPAGSPRGISRSGSSSSIDTTTTPPPTDSETDP
jgi:hypothetical protein